MASRSSGTGGTPPTPSTTAGFVGRERELESIVDAVTGPPALILVEGEPGIGKSRLVHEALTSGPIHDRSVMTAICPPLEEPFPLGPIVDALHRLRPDGGGFDEVDGTALSPLGGALRPLFPEWADGLPPAPDPLEDPRATRHRLFRAVAELMERLGVDVLLLEDAHWADTATLDFLLMLATVGSGSIDLVVTYRPTDVPAGSPLLRLTSRSPRERTQLRLALGSLTVAETTLLVTSMFDVEEVSHEFASFLHQHTDGVPLALEETLSLLRERGDITRRGGQWSRRALEDLQVPPTVRDSVLERLDRLDPPARRVLEAAATLAEPTDEATLAQVAGLDPDVTRAGLAEALGSGLLREVVPGRFAGRHVLASRAVEEAVPISERRRFHRRAAETLATHPTPPVARLSRHFREANDVAQWTHYAEAAAALALESGAERAAVVLLHDLLSGADHPPARRARLARQLGEAATWGVDALGDLAAEVTTTLAAVLGDDGAGDDAERGEIRLLLGRLLLQLGEFDAAADQIEAAVGELASRPELAAQAMISLAFPRGHTWPAAKHLDWVDRATALMPLVGSEEQRTWLAVDRASALLMLGDPAGWRAAEDFGHDATTLPARRQVARGHMNVGHLAIAWGLHDEAGRRLHAADDLMRETGYHRLMNSTRLTLALLDWYSGRWDGLAARVTELADAEDTLPEAQLEARFILASLDLATGRTDAAAEALTAVLAEVTRRGLVDVQVAPAAALGRLRLAQGDAGEAVALTAPIIELIATKGMWLWATDIAVVHLDALVAAGRAPEARSLFERFSAGLGAAADAVPDNAPPAPAAALEVCHGILAVGRHDHAGAADHVAHAARAWAALPRPYDELLTIERQGRVALAAGSRDLGLTTLAGAQQRLHELGATWDADRIAQLLRGEGVEVARTWRGGRRGYGDQLSPRELEVARLVARGMTNRQVADALYLSPRTVDRHLGTAMRKLGVSSRTALAMAAADAGLLSTHPEPD